jgi:hypothetical protein
LLTTETGAEKVPSTSESVDKSVHGVMAGQCVHGRVHRGFLAILSVRGVSRGRKKFHVRPPQEPQNPCPSIKMVCPSNHFFCAHGHISGPLYTKGNDENRGSA